MTEVEKIRYAREFLEKLAAGTDPTDNTQIPQGDVARKERVVGCFNYISGVLRRLEQSGGVSAPVRRPSRREVFSLTDDEKKRIEITKAPVTISEISRHLNNLVSNRTNVKISYNTISKWLVRQGFLEEIHTDSGKMMRVPTALGRENGIYSERRVGATGEFSQVLYRAEAQRLIYDNIDAIARGEDGEDR